MLNLNNTTPSLGPVNNLLVNEANPVQMSLSVSKHSGVFRTRKESIILRSVSIGFVSLYLIG
jgi:hypothetical protein